MDPTVSILMPCYNAARWVRDALDSALTQTCESVEILVVDDGSTDDTLSILREFEGRVQVHATPNQGCPAARNFLLERARGRWIQALDADDLLDADKIERQLAFATEHPCELVVAPTRQERAVVNAPDDDDPWICLFRGRLGLTVANLWQRAAVERAGGWNPARACVEDYDLIGRMLATGTRIGYFPDALTEHRLVNPQSLYLADRVESLTQRCAVAEEAVAGLTERGELRPEQALEAARLAQRSAVALWPTDRAAARDLDALARRLSPQIVAEVRAASRVYGRIYATLGFGAAQRYAATAAGVRGVSDTRGPGLGTGDDAAQ